MVSLPLILLLVCPPLTAEQPQAPASGRISGRVSTSDARLPAGVNVTLMDLNAPARRWTTISGSRGEFSFAGLPEGRYELSAVAAGLTSRSVDGSRLGVGQEIALEQNESLVDVRLALRRTASIAGRILQPEGTPAPGVQVMVALRAGARPVAVTGTRVFSEWDGRYQIDDLPPGEYFLLVLPAPDGASPHTTPLPPDVSTASLRFEPTLYPGVPTSGAGGSVRIHEGVPAEGIDVWLLPAAQRYSVSGRVFWPEGLEVRNVVIEYGGTPDVRSGIWYIDDPGGLFTLDGIAQGTLVMLARGESSRGPLVGIATTDVLASIEEVRIVLQPSGSLSGRVVFEQPLPSGTSPRVRLVHALLRVSPLYPPEEAVVQENGVFEIRHALGTYAIDAIDLPAGWRVRRITRDGELLPGNRIVIEPGDATASIEILVGPD